MPAFGGFAGEVAAVDSMTFDAFTYSSATVTPSGLDTAPLTARVHITSPTSIPVECGPTDCYLMMLLSRVSGLSTAVAGSIVRWRDTNGAFRNRQQLLDVAGLGAKTFEQSAGFLRINGGDNPLDMTGVHPETYPVVEGIIARTGKPVAELMGRAEMLKTLQPELFANAQFGVITVRDILTELDRLGVLPGRYRLLDVSAELRARQQDRLNALSPELRGIVEWVDRLPGEIHGVVLGNEVLDALPVRLAEWTGDGVFERGVAWGTEGFRWARGGPCDGELALALQGIEVPPPYVTEVGLQARALVATLAERLRAGALILIDYGFGSREFHHPQRSQGTLMCHYRHHAHGDPFHLPGLQDITAHVDFTAVATAGVSHGLSLAGYTTQAHFLVNCGITELLAEAGPSGSRSYLALAAQAQRLLSPSEMGELFKAVALVRGLERPLTGFAHGDLSRLL